MVQSHSLVLVSNHNADQVDHVKHQYSSVEGSVVAQGEEKQQGKLIELFEGR